jgi:hypothetical protein
VLAACRPLGLGSHCPERLAGVDVAVAILVPDETAPSNRRTSSALYPRATDWMALGRSTASQGLEMTKPILIKKWK